MPSKFTAVAASGQGVGGHQFVPLTAAELEQLSDEIFYDALPDIVIRQFITIGESVSGTLQVTWMKIHNLPSGSRVAEDEEIEPTNLPMSSVAAVASEITQAIAYTKLSMLGTRIAVLAEARKALSRNYRVTIEQDARDAILGANSTVFGAQNIAGQYTSVSALSSLDSTCLFSDYTMREAVENLTTNNAPTFEGGNYACIVHPHQQRNIRESATWEAVNVQNDPSKIWSNEVGNIHGARVVQTTLTANGRNSAVSPSTGYYADYGYDATYEAVDSGSLDACAAMMLGPGFLGYASVQDMMVVQDTSENFDRFQAIGYIEVSRHQIVQQDYGQLVVTV